ncbi:HTH-type transcriptional regulator CdhR [compost metagenome]
MATLAYHGLCTFEFGISVEIFGLPRPELDIPWYKHAVVGVDDGQMRASGGIHITSDTGIDALPAARTIIIPGWRSQSDAPPQPLLDALRVAHANGARLLSICSGAFLLAATGLLDGRRATTHWQLADELALRYPAIKVDSNVLYVDEGQLITSAGSAAGIDACLHLVARDHGFHVANTVARRLVMAPHRSGGQSQFITLPMNKLPRNELTRALQWARENLSQPISVTEMANKAAMSERTFQRRFKQTSGQSPKEWLQQERVRQARALLERTRHSTAFIAQTCGFTSADTFRVAFKTVVGLSPGTYRKHFGNEEILDRPPTAQSRNS